MKTIIVWFRNDLRIHDHPALATAVEDADIVIPLFILNKDLLKGNSASSNRNRFLLESLTDLKSTLQSLRGDLVVRDGDPANVLLDIAKEVGASDVYCTADFTPYSIKRDKLVRTKLQEGNVTFRNFSGRLIVSSLDALLTKTGSPYKVFTPFWKNWQQVQRRELAASPKNLTLPTSLSVGSLPSIDEFAKQDLLSPNALKGGETEGRKRLKAFLANDIASYHDTNNMMAADATSRLSSYLHFGCLSPLEIETMLESGAGPDAWHRQLAWREFYNYVLYKFPNNTKQEFQERYRTFDWSYDETKLDAWKQGNTGYPIVDAAMRQLLKEGWIHNRSRLIVGSFLTKDLLLDWRLGEQHFLRWLLDGDVPNNNGNWQWIASVGVDPAPVFRRLYNPASQQERYDPEGAYVRKYVPELKNVPDNYLSNPSSMPKDIQLESNCIIGKDYPRPIVDHKEARLAALEKYRSTT